jgi:hypothetical protein
MVVAERITLLTPISPLAVVVLAKPVKVVERQLQLLPERVMVAMVKPQTSVALWNILLVVVVLVETTTLLDILPLRADWVAVVRHETPLVGVMALTVLLTLAVAAQVAAVLRQAQGVLDVPGAQVLSSFAMKAQKSLLKAATL